MRLCTGELDVMDICFSTLSVSLLMSVFLRLHSREVDYQVPYLYVVCFDVYP